MYFGNHLEKWIGHTDGVENHHGWDWGCLVFHFGCDISKILMNTSDHQAVESVRCIF